MSMPRSSTPLTAASRHIGTIRIDRQRQRPALVLRREHQEDEHDRRAEDVACAVLPASFS